MSSNTTRLHRHNFGTLIILGTALALSLPASAAKKHSAGANKVKFEKSSEESRKDRDRRLSRECKGQVNAGACAGYTR